MFHTFRKPALGLYTKRLRTVKRNTVTGYEWQGRSAKRTSNAPCVNLSKLHLLIWLFYERLLFSLLFPENVRLFPNPLVILIDRAPSIDYREMFPPPGLFAPPSIEFYWIEMLKKPKQFSEEKNRNY